MSTWVVLRRALGLLALLELASCLPEGPPLSLRRQTDDDAGTPPINVDPRVNDAAVELGTIDPHGLVGVDPSRGSFKGGQARIVRGNGFAPGDTDVVAEFKVDSVRLPHGAQMWRLTRDGTEELVATFDADKGRWVRTP